MKLINLLKDLAFDCIQGHIEREIKGVTCDSRKVREGFLFVAIKGFETDGSQFIPQAIAGGATAIMAEKGSGYGELPKEITLITVENARLALACVSHYFYKSPTEKLHTVGITGTNGKTSVATYIESILHCNEKKVGIVGTLGVKLNSGWVKTGNTTPESCELQFYADEMVKEKMDFLVMEASSHALELDRVAYCDFKEAIFTNLSPDHLELHGTMEAYFESKAKLFEMAKKRVILNVDDPYGLELCRRHPSKTLTYAISHPADIMAKNIEKTLLGTHFTLQTPQGSQEVKLHLPGDIFVLNALAAAAWAYDQGISPEIIAQGLEKIKAISGRMEVVHHDENYHVVIDFAHTEDGLEKVLKSIRPFVKNRLCLVFGVYAPANEPGLSKRQGMAAVAASYADFSVLTSDNPKFQNPQTIIDEISSYLEKNKANYQGIVDREEAILFALKQLEPGDVLLIAGKGHETSQNIAGQEVPFSEKDIVKKYYQSKSLS